MARNAWTCAISLIMLAGLGSFAPHNAQAETVNEQEPNDGFGNATFLASGSTCLGAVGWPEAPADPADYFGFNMSKQQEYTLTVLVSATNGSCNLAIYNPQRTIHTYTLVKSAPYPWNQKYNVGELNGTWYLSVRGSRTNYTVTVSLGFAASDLPPAIAITSPQNNSAVNSSLIAVSGTASDDGSVTKVMVYPDGAPVASWTLATGTTSWNATVSIDGYIGSDMRVGIWAQATDNASQKSSTYITVSWGGGQPPASYPRINITSPAEGSVVWARNITVEGSVEDERPLLGVEVSHDPGNWESATLHPGAGGHFTWNATLTVGPGPCSIMARARDSVNQNMARVNITVQDPGTDTEKPVVSITYPARFDTITTKKITVRGTASDDNGIATILLNISLNWAVFKIFHATTSDGWANWSADVELYRSQVSISAVAEDLAGNTAETGFSVFVDYKDTVKPTVHITSHQTGCVTNESRILIRGNATDDEGMDRMEGFINNVLFSMPIMYSTGIINWSESVSLNMGSNSINITARDFAGNVGWDQITVIREPLNTVKPTVHITSPKSGTVTDETHITVKGNASDDIGLDRMEGFLNNVSFSIPISYSLGIINWSVSVTLHVGKNIINITAIDISKNIAWDQITVTNDVSNKPFPGFELPSLAFALLAALVIFFRRKRA